jgi:hypothetical protein
MEAHFARQVVQKYRRFYISAALSQSADTIDEKRSNRLSSSATTPLLIHDFRVINHLRVSLCRSLLRGDRTSPAVLNTRSGAVVQVVNVAKVRISIVVIVSI